MVRTIKDSGAYFYKLSPQIQYIDFEYRTSCGIVSIRVQIYFCFFAVTVGFFCHGMSVQKRRFEPKMSDNAMSDSVLICLLTNYQGSWLDIVYMHKHTQYYIERYQLSEDWILSYGDTNLSQNISKYSPKVNYEISHILKSSILDL